MSNLPFSDNVDILKTSLKIGNNTVPNRIAIQPMEGCDGTVDGAPDELTYRRYDRFAKSGAGLVWFEAVAVEPNGRANPRQLWLTEKNLDSFKKIVNDIKETALKETGITPIIIMQATHSGRYSKPHGTPEPLIAYNSPIFEGDNPISADRIITDDDIKHIEESYSKTAKLSVEAGFDGLDVKCCHRYLNSELLSAFTRAGEYGGSFENRTRFFKNAVANVRAHVSSDFIVTSRMNIYDGFPYPYGFGVAPNNGIEPDLSEPIRLIGELNLELLDITMGNPYFNSEVNRPVEIAAVERVYKLTKQVQDHFPSLAIIASAPTFMKAESGALAAGAIEQGYCQMVGFGRMAFAYPDFAKDILNGRFDSKKACITCGKCTELMRAGSVTGCVIRDAEYTKIYREVCAK